MGRLIGVGRLSHNALARETRLNRGLEPAIARYDYVLIACPPSLM